MTYWNCLDCVLFYHPYVPRHEYLDYCRWLLEGLA